MSLGDREDVQQFARCKIAELLDQCTEAQRRGFLRIFGGSAHDISSDKLTTALALCERTIRENERTGRLKAVENG